MRQLSRKKLDLLHRLDVLLIAQLPAPPIPRAQSWYQAYFFFSSVCGGAGFDIIGAGGAGRSLIWNLARGSSHTVHPNYQAHGILRRMALIVRHYGLLHLMVPLAARARPELEPAQAVAFESATYLDCARL
jgi:hypothetical protein